MAAIDNPELSFDFDRSKTPSYLRFARRRRSSNMISFLKSESVRDRWRQKVRIASGNVGRNAKKETRDVQ